MTNDALRSPHRYDRRILLAVTGLAPQVVTETLYALAVNSRPAWVPTEVLLVTSEEGAAEARRRLLPKPDGWFHRLRANYALPEIEFDLGRIRVLEDAVGRPLGDIRTVDDNTSVADFLTDQVRALTKDEHCALHVSIAGGRRTMGLYAGFALSLYGRSQDRLSHVLVDSPFESHADFFYPSPTPELISADGESDTALDKHRASVALADIPFVRFRDGVSASLLDGRVSFSEAVAEAQLSLPPVALMLDVARCRVTAGGEAFSLRPSQFAFYWMLAERARSGKHGTHWSEPGAAREFLSYYGRVVSTYSGRYEAAVKSLGSGLTKSNFDPQKSHINRRLIEALGRKRAGPYLISARERIPGKRCSRFGLKVQPRAVRVIGLAGRA